jgi:hypothetical protein
VVALRKRNVIRLPSPDPLADTRANGRAHKLIGIRRAALTNRLAAGFERIRNGRHGDGVTAGALGGDRSGNIHPADRFRYTRHDPIARFNYSDRFVKRVRRRLRQFNSTRIGRRYRVHTAAARIGVAAVFGCGGYASNKMLCTR